MRKFCVRLTLVYTPGDEGSYSDFVSRFERALDDLAARPDLSGSDPDQLLIRCAVEVDNAATPLDAVLIGTSTIRSAAHAADVATGGWPEADDWPTWLREQAIEAHEIVELARA